MDASTPQRPLTEQQTDQVINFQSMSGLDDFEDCRQLLERNGWDTSRAFQDVFNEPRDPSPERDVHDVEYRDEFPVRRRPVAVERIPQPTISPSSHVVYAGGAAPTAVVQWGLFDWIKAVISFPFRFVFTSVFDVFNFVWSFVSGPTFPANTPTQDVQSFIADFEGKYGAVHPTFYRGGYKEAYGDAKRELRFLLLYLHQENHSDSDRFCADTLVHPEVVSLINSRAVFWACSTKYAEGHKVAQALQVSRYPSIGLCINKNSQMTLVGRLQGYHSVEELIDRLNQLFASNDRHLSSARQERQTLDLNQSLRKEQDEAYLKSLKADQDKEKKKRDDKLRKEEEERLMIETAERKAREEHEKEESLIKRKQHAAGLVPEEPKDGDAESCRLSFKLPAGDRLERRFSKSDKIADIYNFIFGQPTTPEHFEVFTSYPRKAIGCSPASHSTLDSLKLGKAEAFIVEEKDETDDEDDLDQPLSG
ncbi:FAS-associated factor 2-B [Hypsibius exemplaris]|uniref:FAS-associated factor 2-B n=1 Tax=Hypsibius exemplaris TaxID=2072580 RepID=A0A1W0WAT0_HYPEX|nr:FAS-associated factor 2-B [Hypsibius exemplaris]